MCGSFTILIENLEQKDCLNGLITKVLDLGAEKVVVLTKNEHAVLQIYPARKLVLFYVFYSDEGLKGYDVLYKEFKKLCEEYNVSSTVLSYNLIEGDGCCNTVYDCRRTKNTEFDEGVDYVCYEVVTAEQSSWRDVVEDSVYVPVYDEGLFSGVLTVSYGDVSMVLSNYLPVEIQEHFRSIFFNKGKKCLF